MLQVALFFVNRFNKNSAFDQVIALYITVKPMAQRVNKTLDNKQIKPHIHTNLNVLSKQQSIIPLAR